MFIDFENVGQYCSPDRIGNWLQWIEDGEFDDDSRKRRRLVEKRVYWNSTHQKFEDIFKRHGFDIVLCEKFANLKNGADIRIALDVMESVIGPHRIDEFILFAQDTDYVPVIQRLDTKGRLSAILVDERQERVFTAYDLHADITIPLREFQAEALTYERRRRLREAINAFKRRFLRKPSATTLHSAPATPQPAILPSAPAQRATRAQKRHAELGPVGMAERAVLRVTSLKPGKYTAREDIERELFKIQGFAKHGANKYFHLGSYEKLMKEIGKRTERLKIEDGVHGGVSVRYVPEDDE